MSEWYKNRATRPARRAGPDRAESLRARAIEVVESWGFVPSGRVWRRVDLGMGIDLLGETLHGSRLRPHRKETTNGSFCLLGVEDLLIKRSAELKHGHVADPNWRRELQRQIRILLAEYGNLLDEECLAFVARRDDVIDILADFLSHVGPAAPRRE